MCEIVVECKPDEALIRTLGFSRKEIVHQPSKARVLNYLEKNRGCIGIVDEDPGAINAGYFNKYQKQVNLSKHDLEVYTCKKIDSRLIIVKPRLEEWVLRQAISTKINPAEFSLPTDGYQLHKMINDQIPKFEKMLISMFKQKNDGLNYLKKLIKSGE